jgi:hypothetical protein
LHTKRLMVNFETDEKQQEREIDSKTHEITEVFHHAEGILKKFGKDSERSDITTAEKTVRKNMQMSIAKKLQGLSMSFRSTQKVSALKNNIICYHVIISSVVPQQYMTRLQGQKAGDGNNLSFLNEPAKASSSSSEHFDSGFDEIQMQELEEAEVVSLAFLSQSVELFLMASLCSLLECQPARRGDRAHCKEY